MPPNTILYAFEARYHGPTNALGSRISVRSNGGKWRFYGYDHAADCAFKAAVLQYIAADAQSPADGRRFVRPPDAVQLTARKVFETAKGYIVVAYWVDAVPA